MEELQLEHTSRQWRFLTDLSMVSLKAVLLHNGNTFLSIPLVHAVHMKEMYEYLQVFSAKKYALKNTGGICVLP
jgi:hypothetical protein